jgi:hypothetical protein
MLSDVRDHLRQDVRNEKILGDVSARTLQSTLKEHTFRITRRHGKNLFA